MCNKTQYLELKNTQLQLKKKKKVKAGGNYHRISFQRGAVGSPFVNAFQVRLAALPEGALQVDIITEFST